MAAAVADGVDEDRVAELREKFREKYIDSPSPEVAKFDERDLNRFWGDSLFALSFIHWKKGVIKDAVEMVAQVLEWRKVNGVTDLSVETIGQQYFEKGIIYLHGRGTDGSRVLCQIGRLQDKSDKDAVRQVFMFWLERLQRSEPGKHITFILDTHKASMSSVELGSIKFIIDAFTTYFPDLLERIIILDMPWIMGAIWKVVRQWMSEEQRRVVVFCTRKELHQYVAADQRPKDMDGTSDWAYSFPPFPDDLSQTFDFKTDPMNFKAAEKPEPSKSAESNQEAGSPCQQNGEIGNTAKEIDTEPRKNGAPRSGDVPKEEPVASD